MHHNEDMWDMGGLRERMPVTYYTFLSGSLALAGILPFAGFWSKDEVLYEAFVHGLNSPILLVAYAMGLLAVFFTGFYTFRMVFLTFHGEPRSDLARDPHRVRWNVKAPLVVLGVLAAVAGFVNMVPVQKVLGLPIDFLHQWLDGPEELSSLTVHHYHEVIEAQAGYAAGAIGSELLTVFLSAGVSLSLAVGGAALAYRLYNVPEPVEHTDRLGELKTVLYNNYYQDEYQVWVADTVGVGIAQAADRFDGGVVDGVVNGISSVSLFSGSRLRRLQTGVVTNYAALVALGLVVLILAVGIAGGWFL
jgi:NADH-quinone oxidoreductase subunit L